MESIKVIYWSGTGNTEQMAEAVAQGIEKGGAAADVREVSEVSAEILKGENVFALGCPAMGAEVLEEDNMEPFMSELEGELEGRTVGLFGSYGWGDGEWMRDWEKRVTGHGVVLAEGEGVIGCEEPDEETLRKCRELGESLAKAAMERTAF